MYFVSAGATGEEDELTPGPFRGYRLTAPSTSACAGFPETIDTRASRRTFIQTRYGVYSLEPVEK